ncbi:antitoxin Xre/MbcA/ParS toxin-binding domain-containing protein [Pseudoalteromonas arctica]|uniref:DUF2384 domain-containing protein n=1 Tax=Pseudoalteromonas arctica TaxID=394751 RepID=A0A7Y0DVU6_9GAMM|nr:antitoxin Xre/MbcA/ParS toxin-binding domain-containing protein [Pseudoalteromonas arctica]NMM42553.1 DUF2384 domain-containing protein [Pseudoalteromonas arctica]
MKNPLCSKAVNIDGKLMIEIPEPVIKKLAISPDDFIEFGNAKTVSIWKSENVDVPTDVFEILIDIFKTEDYVFQWLNKKQKYLLGKTPITLLNTSAGKEEVLGLIERLKRGDFS